MLLGISICSCILISRKKIFFAFFSCLPQLGSPDYPGVRNTITKLTKEGTQDIVCSRMVSEKVRRLFQDLVSQSYLLS